MQSTPSFDFHQIGYRIRGTQCFERSFEKPRLNSGVSILGQECPKPLAHFTEQWGRKHVDISSKSVDAYETQLCEYGGDVSPARVVEIEIEVAIFLLRRQRHDPKHLVVEFLDDKHGARKVAGA